MRNIILILKREYLTRVKKKSFIIMTLLAPILIGGIYGIAIWAVVQGTELQTINVVDDSKMFEGKFENDESYAFNFIKEPISLAKKEFGDGKSDALVHIPADILDNPKGVQIYGENAIPLELQMKVEKSIEKEVERFKLAQAGITQEVLSSAKMNVKSKTINLKDGDEKASSSGGASAAGIICGFMIYMAVFIYGAQVMRGVMEEKRSRIVEVIISSVKPFQLLLGKILGVAMVGLTQFGLWILLTLAITTVVVPMIPNAQEKLVASQTANMPEEMKDAASEQVQMANSGGAMAEVFQAIDSLPITTIVISFLFYFFGGYMLYSSLFGAVGAAVDSETDTQQFMMPITIPIIASIMVAQFVMRDPHGTLAFWFSMIPLTSPIIMMVRIPFGVPVWEIVLSITLLIGGFVFTTWIASRIYRVGILMYGKKPTWKELGKWIFYKG